MREPFPSRRAIGTTQSTIMKISNEPVTLSPEHSRYVRALAHAMGETDLDTVMEDLTFTVSPVNHLECYALDLESATPDSERSWEAHELAKKAGRDWEAFVKIAEQMPVYQESNYETAAA